MSLENIQSQLSSLAKLHNVPCISSATEAYLLQYLMKNKPMYCCEIGSAFGYSTLTIGSSIAGRGGSLISFEISHPSYMIAMYHIRQAKSFNIFLYHLNILFTPIDNLFHHSLDFVFVDGAKAEYAAYLGTILPYCSPTATIICDDVIMYADKVNPIYDIIKKHTLSYEQISLDDGDGILVITMNHT